MINCIRSIKGSRGYDTAVAPTGCAASLLNGGTTYRTFRLPVGKKAKKAPSNEGFPTDIDEAKAMVMQLVKLFCIIKDEDSMDTRESWACLGNAWRRPGRLYVLLLNRSPNYHFHKKHL
jgi:hypothetical protein